MDFIAKVMLLSVPKLAEMWDVDRQYIEDLIAKHELPIVLIGDKREIRVRISDVIIWVDKNMTAHEVKEIRSTFGLGEQK